LWPILFATLQLHHEQSKRGKIDLDFLEIYLIDVLTADSLDINVGVRGNRYQLAVPPVQRQSTKL